MIVNIYVETTPMNHDLAVRFKKDVEVDGNTANVYLNPERAILALAFLAATLEAEVYKDGELVEAEL
jgi:hypothetical protein